jgi:hypothetical protein
MSQPPGRGDAGKSWEDRAAGLATDVQRWLIKKSARSMRDEVGDQVKKVFRGGQDNAKQGGGDTWATATTEPPDMPTDAPECAWCPVCRAARRIAEARAAGSGSSGDSGGSGGSGGTQLPDISEALTGAVRDVLAGLDSVLSYRPGEPGSARPNTTRPGGDRAEEPEDEPGHRS